MRSVWVLLVCVVAATPVYESVSYCTSSFTCTDGVCQYLNGKTCANSDEFTQDNCGLGTECKLNDPSFCCSPDSVGDTYCTSLTEQGRFNTKVTETCPSGSPCTIVTEFCSYRIVYVEVGADPAPNEFTAFFEGLTTKTQKLNDTLHAKDIITNVGPWEWKRNDAEIELTIDTNSQDVVKQAVTEVVESFSNWLEEIESCAVQTSVLYHFDPSNVVPIEVIVDISIHGNIINSTGTHLQAELYVSMVPLFGFLLNMLY